MSIFVFKEGGVLEFRTDEGTVKVYRDTNGMRVYGDSDIINQLGGYHKLVDLYHNWGHGNARREYVSKMEELGRNVIAIGNSITQTGNILKESVGEGLDRLSDSMEAGFDELGHSLAEPLLRNGETVGEGLESIGDSINRASELSAVLEAFRIKRKEEEREEEMVSGFYDAKRLLEITTETEPDMLVSDFISEYNGNHAMMIIIDIMRQTVGGLRKGMTLTDLVNKYNGYKQREAGRTRLVKAKKRPASDKTRLTSDKIRKIAIKRAEEERDRNIEFCEERIKELDPEQFEATITYAQNAIQWYKNSYVNGRVEQLIRELEL